MTQFYDSLASHYHLIFQDWTTSIHRQAAIITRLLPAPNIAGHVLDCACGIGTQALGLCALGYAVEGSDLSPAEIERARYEAAARRLDIDFRIDDMRTLNSAPAGRYGAAINMDNAFAHLDGDAEIETSLQVMRRSLQPSGTLLISVRDYAPLIAERPKSTTPAVYDDHGRRRTVSQTWDWIDDRRYVAHIEITRETADGSAILKFSGQLRAVLPDEIADLAIQNGFHDVHILSPAETGYYQPIVRGIRAP
jgi:SAM-dependent methyltransferase